MDKIKKEIFFLILCILSLIGCFLCFIFLQQYIPEFFIYINNNWSSGFTDIIQSNQQGCKLPLVKDKSLKFYKNSQKDFFNNEIINLKNEENINSFNLLNINLNNYSQCLKNRSNYFDTKLNKYEEGNDFENCKFIDSLNNTSCENYSNSMMNDDFTKYTDIVFSQGQPCFDPRFYNLNITLNKTSYYYDKSKCPNGRTNKYYKVLKNVTIEALLDYNNLEKLKKIISEDIRYQDFYIYGRNYIGIKEECRNKPFNKLSKIIEDVNHYISSAIAWTGYISIIEIVFFLLFINRFTVKYHNYINNVNKEDNKKKKELLPPYTKPVILILSLIQLGFHILVFTYFLNIRDFIDLFYDTSCFEEEAGELISSSIIFLNIARFVQLAVLAINAILAFKYGIKKGIKYAN